MELNAIKSLLEKYWEGETSLAEEKTLKAYFAQPDIAPELQAYQAFFDYTKSEKELELSLDFDEKLLSKMNASTPQLTIATRTRTRTIFRWISSAAAMFLLCLASYIAYNGYEKTEQKPGAKVIILDDAADAEEAYEKVKAALLLVSNKMNKGKTEAVNGLNKINVIDKVRNKK